MSSNDASRHLTVAHAMALTPEDDVPRRHALALVAAAGGRLVSIHATDALDPEAEIPDAMPILRGWAKARGVTTSDLGSVQLERMLEHGPEGLHALLLAAVDEVEADLVVAGTRARRSVDRAFMGSTAQELIRKLEMPVLLLPVDCRGFVDPRTGQLTLRKILVPIGDAEAAQRAVDAAVSLIERAALDPGELVFVRVGDEASTPPVKLPSDLGWGRRWVQVEGSVVGQVVERANEEHADLVVMASRGHDSLLDSVLGSHTERVLQRSPCALLAVPMGE